MCDEAKALAELVKAWWEENKFATTGEYGEWNVFDFEPDFVKKAKEIIGDWEGEN